MARLVRLSPRADVLDTLEWPSYSRFVGLDARIDCLPVAPVAGSTVPDRRRLDEPTAPPADDI